MEKRHQYVATSNQNGLQIFISKAITAITELTPYLKEAEKIEAKILELEQQKNELENQISYKKSELRIKQASVSEAMDLNNVERIFDVEDFKKIFKTQRLIIQRQLPQETLEIIHRMRLERNLSGIDAMIKTAKIISNILEGVSEKILRKLDRVDLEGLSDLLKEMETDGNFPNQTKNLKNYIQKGLQIREARANHQNAKVAKQKS